MAKKAVRRRQQISADETASQRFVRVVSPRVTKAVKAIKVIGYCAGSTYEYTPKQVAEISMTLQLAIDSLTAVYDKKADTQDSFAFEK